MSDLHNYRERGRHHELPGNSRHRDNRSGSPRGGGQTAAPGYDHHNSHYRSTPAADGRVVIDLTASDDENNSRAHSPYAPSTHERRREQSVVSLDTHSDDGHGSPIAGFSERMRHVVSERPPSQNPTPLALQSREPTPATPPTHLDELLTLARAQFDHALANGTYQEQQEAMSVLREAREDRETELRRLERVRQQREREIAGEQLPPRGTVMDGMHFIINREGPQVYWDENGRAYLRSFP